MKKNGRIQKWGMKFYFMVLMVFFLGTYNSLPAQEQAQQITVSGVVMDTNELPIPGATVRVKGTTLGTITNMDGFYSVNIPSIGSVLQYSFIGFEFKEMEVRNAGNMNIVLQEETVGLDEVVVVGYGSQQKSHLTGSISRITDENMAYIPVTSVDQALQGKIAGVTIVNTTSEAGVAPQIRVRGMGSISASNEPLIVVDGMPMEGGLSAIQMSDIASVETLKDAASSAIYGSRGANGVILITTKSGVPDQRRYTFNMTRGFKTNYKLHPMLMYDEMVALQYEEAALRASDPLWTGPANRTSPQELAEYIIATQINKKNTDWQNQGLRDVAHVQDYQFSVSGGTKASRFYLSANVNSDQGAMLNNQFDKYSIRARLDTELSKRVTVGVNISPSYTFRERPSTNYTDFYRFRTWVPDRHTEATAALTGYEVGSYAHPRHFSGISYEGYTPDGQYWASAGPLDPWTSTNNNPTAVMEGEFRKRHQYSMSSNSYINIKLAKGLSLRASQGFFARYEEENIYTNANARRDGEPNKGQNSTNLLTDVLSENILNYQTSIGEQHNLSGLLGATYQRTNNTATGIVGINFPTDDIYTLNKATSIDAENTFTYKFPEVLASYLSRLNYNYRDKYLFSASLRTDGSSLFGAENRWSWFPSVSIGWRMEQEPFMAGLVWLDQLKPRISYGVTGNNDIVPYAYSNNLLAAHYALGRGNNVIPGLAATGNTLGNPDITWERTLETNYGLDLSVLRNRIFLVLDYYSSITDQLLYEQSSMAFTGHEQFWNNIGKISNKGLEVELTTINFRNRNFEWSSSFNIAFNKNELLELGGEPRQLNSGERNELYVSIVGDPSIQFFGYKTDGLWQSAQEITDAVEAGFESTLPLTPGGLKIVDTDGSGRIDALDRVPLGDPFPDYNWGFSNSFKYKSFDLSILFQGVQGVDLVNGDGYYTEMKKQGRNYVENRWISPSFPGDGKTPYRFEGPDIMLTDYVVEDGSYAALRELVFGYNLNKPSANRMGLENVRLYFSGTNLLFLMSSEYRGINPESRYTFGPYSNPLIDGYQRGGFPIQRVFAFGLEVTF